MEAATATLLWAACRPSPDGEAVRSVLDAGADVARAATVAVAQRVSPLLWAALVDSGAVRGREHEAWARHLRGDAARCRAQGLLVLPRIGMMVLSPLAEADLRPLVFKGAALADRYPEPGLRPMDDVDLVLPHEQLDAGIAVLQEAGWRTVPVQSAHHEVILVHDELPGLPVELHRALATWRERSNHLTTAVLWDWRASGVVAGVEVFVLPLEEEIVALAAHAAKPFHVFDRLIWTVDLAVVMSDAERRGRSIDWDRVAYLASASRCGTAVAVALSQATRLGVSSPPELRQAPARRARARAVLPLLSPEWPLVDRSWGLRSRLRYALVDDWRQRLTLLVGQAIESGPAAAPRKAFDLCRLGVRRWAQLRREAARSYAGDRPPSEHDPTRSDAA